jgi:hypothetical protein
VAQRHDRSGTERAGRVDAVGADTERCEQRLVASQRVVDRPDRLVAGRTVCAALSVSPRRNSGSVAASSSSTGAGRRGLRTRGIL